MSNEQSIRDEIADEISGITVGSGYYSTTIGIDAAQEAATAIMPLVRKAQAEAVREAADDVDGDGMISRRELEPYWEGWDDAIRGAVETVRKHASRIEQSSEGNEA